MIREELGLGKQNGGWKPQRRKRIIWPFLPSKWVKFSVLLINFFCWSELIQVHFYFIFIFLFDPSWSELIRTGQAIRVDPVRLLYLPLKKTKHWAVLRKRLTTQDLSGLSPAVFNLRMVLCGSSPVARLYLEEAKCLRRRLNKASYDWLSVVGKDGGFVFEPLLFSLIWSRCFRLNFHIVLVQSD